MCERCDRALDEYMDIRSRAIAEHDKVERKAQMDMDRVVTESLERTIEIVRQAADVYDQVRKDNHPDDFPKGGITRLRRAD